MHRRASRFISLSFVTTSGSIVVAAFTALDLGSGSRSKLLVIELARERIGLVDRVTGRVFLVDCTRFNFTDDPSELALLNRSGLDALTFAANPSELGALNRFGLDALAVAPNTWSAGVAADIPPPPSDRRGCGAVPPHNAARFDWQTDKIVRR